jgi:hypothetical protein
MAHEFRVALRARCALLLALGVLFRIGNSLRALRAPEAYLHALECTYRDLLTTQTPSELPRRGSGRYLIDAIARDEMSAAPVRGAGQPLKPWPPRRAGQAIGGPLGKPRVYSNWLLPVDWQLAP